MLKIVIALALIAIPNSTPVEDDAKGKTKLIPAAEIYPLDTCAVAGKKLGSMGEPIVYVHEGRQVKFCCKSCLPTFKKNPDKYVANVNNKIIKTQKPSYPTNKCLFSDEELGPKSKDVVVNNRLVRVCCGGCAKKLHKDPTPTLKKLDELIIAKQGANYPLNTCIVSKEALGSMGKPKDIIVSNTLVRVCCKGCVKTVTKNPAAAVAKVKAAAKKK